MSPDPMRFSTEYDPAPDHDTPSRAEAEALAADAAAAHARFLRYDPVAAATMTVRNRLAMLPGEIARARLYVGEHAATEAMETSRRLNVATVRDLERRGLDVSPLLADLRGRDVCLHPFGFTDPGQPPRCPVCDKEADR